MNPIKSVKNSAPTQEKNRKENFLESDVGSFYVNVCIALIRIVSAYLLITHASAKLFHIPQIEAFDGLQAFTLLWTAGVLEMVGALFLIAGLFTRPIAFILSGELAFAYFIGHAPQGNVFIPMLNGGEAAVLFCFIFLLLSAIGAGKFSLDWKWRNRS